MLFTVHFKELGRYNNTKVLLGTFLMRSDADLFVAHSPISKLLVVSEIDNWEAWEIIKGEIK